MRTKGELGLLNLELPSRVPTASETALERERREYCEDRASGIELIAWWVVALVGSWAALFGISWALFKIATFVRVTW